MIIAQTPNLRVATPAQSASPASPANQAEQASTAGVLADQVVLSGGTEASAPAKVGHPILKKVGCELLDVAKYAGLIGATAATTAFAATPGLAVLGIAASAAGGALGYYLHAKANGEDDANKWAQAGAVVGILGGVAGAAAGPAGILLMSGLGATGATIAKVAHWTEGR